MATKLSQLTENSSAIEAVNALGKAVSNNGGRLILFDAGGGHGQGWAWCVTAGDQEPVASGSIPMTSHGSHNLKVALRALIAAVETYPISD